MKGVQHRQVLEPERTLVVERGIERLIGDGIPRGPATQIPKHKRHAHPERDLRCGEEEVFVELDIVGLEEPLLPPAHLLG